MLVIHKINKKDYITNTKKGLSCRKDPFLRKKEQDFMNALTLCGFVN